METPNDSGGEQETSGRGHDRPKLPDFQELLHSLPNFPDRDFSLSVVERLFAEGDFWPRAATQALVRVNRRWFSGDAAAGAALAEFHESGDIKPIDDVLATIQESFDLKVVSQVHEYSEYCIIRAALAIVRGHARKACEHITDTLTLDTDTTTERSMLAKLLIELDEREAAMAQYQELCRLHTQQLEAGNDPVRHLTNLLVTHRLVAELRQVAGDTQGALESYRSALASAERLAAEQPSALEYQRELAIAHANIGDLFRTQGESEPAIAAYRSALGIQRRLVEADPANADFRHDVVLTLERIGVVHMQRQDHSTAIENFRETLPIRESLVNDNPDDPAPQFEIAVAHFRIGIALHNSSRYTEAIESFKNHLLFIDRIIALEPTKDHWQHDRAVSLFAIGENHLAMQNHAEAFQYISQARAIAQPFALKQPNDSQWTGLLSEIDELLKRVQQPD